jgi:hypothetical protein
VNLFCDPVSKLYLVRFVRTFFLGFTFVKFAM